MVSKKAFASRLLIAFLCFAFVFSMSMCVSAQASEWNGPVEFAEETIRVLMEQSTVVTAPMTNTTGTGIKQATVTYSGEASNILRVGGLSGSSVIDGTLVLYGSIPLTASTTNRSVGLPTLVFESNTPDGITFGGYIRSNSSSAVNYAIEVQFNEYYSTSSTLNIPFKISMKQMMIYQNLDTNYVSSITTSYLNNFQFGGEWAGLIDVYTDLQDNPSMDGYFAEQNQQIIDNSQTQIQNQQTQIQQQEQANQLQQESNEQNKSFMDNFFGNLGSTVLGWIVPSSEDLTNFLDDVNSWFSDRLGFVWYPFDLAYELVSAFTQGEPNSMFKVPGFTLNFQGQQLQIWQPLEVDIDAFDIFKYVRYFTSVLLACGVAHLAINKWDEWIGGHNS